MGSLKAASVRLQMHRLAGREGGSNAAFAGLESLGRLAAALDGFDHFGRKVTPQHRELEPIGLVIVEIKVALVRADEVDGVFQHLRHDGFGLGRLRIRAADFEQAGLLLLGPLLALLGTGELVAGGGELAGLGGQSGLGFGEQLLQVGQLGGVGGAVLRDAGGARRAAERLRGNDGGLFRGKQP